MNQKRLEKLKNAVPNVIPVGMDNSFLFKNIGAKVQFHPDLAQPDSNSRHVYVVCNPHWPLPLYCDHWSLYTQGHFYHLTIDDLASCLLESATSTSKNTGRASKTILSHQDLSSKNTLDYKNYNDKRRKLGLIAYQVGKTNYTHDEIYKLASWIIKHIPIYSRFSNNCQRFVISLVDRIVMTKRDFATFVGNGIQLVEWDTARSTWTSRSGNSHQSCFQNGFEISSGVTEVSRFLSYPSIAEIINDFFGATSLSLAICTMYRQGPRAINQSGLHAHSSQTWAGFRMSAGDFAECGRYFNRVVQEFYEDIRDQKWKDALRGRKETEKEFKDLMAERQKLGDTFTVFETWWCKRVSRRSRLRRLVRTVTFTSKI